MGEANRALRAARERVPSPSLPGEHMTRAELAEAVNAWLWRETGRRFELDDHLVGKWERGKVRTPIPAYRAALRAVLGVDSDHALGFAVPGRARPEIGEAWSLDGIARSGTEAVELELLDRRDALRATAAITGGALVGALTPWLDAVLDGGLRARRGALAGDEVEAVERVVDAFRGWRSPGSGLGRAAVVGQLSDVAERVRSAPAGELADRLFLAAAELARIAGSMAFDDGRARLAREHYVTAVRMATAAGERSFGAVALAALARQAFDDGAVRDGLDVVALARRGSDGAATPALRSLLSTREVWGHAMLGDVRAVERAVGEAEGHQAEVAPAREPRWLAGQDGAELAGTIGARYRDLARHDRRHAGRAVDYLGRALAARDPGRVRNRALDGVALARAHLLGGDVDQSAAVVVSALPLLDTRRPGRVARRLADWHTEARPFATVPAVRDALGAVAEAAPAGAAR